MEQGHGQVCCRRACALRGRGLPSVAPGWQSLAAHQHRVCPITTAGSPRGCTASPPSPLAAGAQLTAHSSAGQSPQGSWDSQAAPGAGGVPLDSSHGLHMEIMLGLGAARTPRTEPSPEASVEKHHHQNSAKTQQLVTAESCSSLFALGPSNGAIL